MRSVAQDAQYRRNSPRKIKNHSASCHSLLYHHFIYFITFNYVCSYGGGWVMCPCVQVPRVACRGCEVSGARLMDVCETSCGCCKLNPAPLQEQQVLLTAKHLSSSVMCSKVRGGVCAPRSLHSFLGVRFDIKSSAVLQIISKKEILFPMFKKPR